MVGVNLKILYTLWGNSAILRHNKGARVGEYLRLDSHPCQFSVVHICYTSTYVTYALLELNFKGCSRTNSSVLQNHTTVPKV